MLVGTLVFAASVALVSGVAMYRTMPEPASGKQLSKGAAITQGVVMVLILSLIVSACFNFLAHGTG